MGFFNLLICSPYKYEMTPQKHLDTNDNSLTTFLIGDYILNTVLEITVYFPI